MIDTELGSSIGLADFLNYLRSTISRIITPHPQLEALKGFSLTYNDFAIQLRLFPGAANRLAGPGPVAELSSERDCLAAARGS
jgi:hypothetical protein